MNILKLQMGISSQRKNRRSSNKMHGGNGKPFISMLHSVLFAPHSCDWLFFIVTLLNLVHTCLFHKGCCRVFFFDNEHKAVKLPHSAQRKHEFMVKSQSKSNSPKNRKKKFCLELLHQEEDPRRSEERRVSSSV